ncbi:hypothetical protein F5X98DRAFT_392009 [Xylaria grammica]|nr:hypothetical protein F5X98DRAFT_392009 [Xylaria grammica]
MPSSNYKPPPEVKIILAQAAAQLDGTTDVVKVPGSDFNKIDKVGQEYIKRSVSSSLGCSVEFFFDFRTQNRVYLGTLKSINRYWPCHAWIVEHLSLPLLIGIYPCVEATNTPYSDAEQPAIASPPDVEQPNPAPLPQARERPLLPAPQTKETKSAKRARSSGTPEASPKPARRPYKRVSASSKVLDTFYAFKDQECGVYAKETREKVEEEMADPRVANPPAKRAKRAGKKEQRTAKPAAPRAQKNTPRSAPVQLGEEQQKGQDSSQPVYATHGIMEHINGRYPRMGEGLPPTDLQEYSLPVEAHNAAEMPGEKECSQPQIAEEPKFDLMSLANPGPSSIHGTPANIGNNPNLPSQGTVQPGSGSGSLVTATPGPVDPGIMDFESELDAFWTMDTADNKLDGGEPKDSQLSGVISPSLFSDTQEFSTGTSAVQGPEQNYGTDFTEIPGFSFQGYTEIPEGGDSATQSVQVEDDSLFCGPFDPEIVDEDCLRFVNFDLDVVPSP